MKSLTLNPSAKINLVLRIFHKRRKQYHHIQSLMQSIDLKDELVLSKTNSRGLSLYCEGMKSGADNIVYKAALNMMSEFGIHCGVAIYLKKRIPMGAGLGGGSSDAASTIIGMRKLFNLKISKENLMKIALRLGSDVPFFLHGGLCLVEGIGERITPIRYMKKNYAIIAAPGISVSTKKAYLWFDNLCKRNRLTDSKNHIRICLRNIKMGLQLAEGGSFYNDFENIIMKKIPILADIREKINKISGYNFHLTGTGSALFAVAGSQNESERITMNIRNIWKDGEVHSAGFLPSEGTGV